MGGLEHIAAQGIAFCTERLTVLPQAPTLAELATLATPAVTAHLPDRLQVGAEGPADLAAWGVDLGRMGPVSTVHTAEAFLGLIMLGLDARELHLGYLLAQPHWGKGYGTELVTGFVATLRAYAPLTLLAGVARANGASSAVLRNAGFVEAAPMPDGTRMYRLTL